MTDEARERRWFVLLVIDGSTITTENPGVECFYSEREAIAFAKECARGKDACDGEVYHVMRSTHFVEAKRRVTVSVAPAK